MSWYKEGSVNIEQGSKTVTGNDTKWTNPLIGVCAGQMLILKTADTIEIYEIASVQSDTQLTLASQYSGATKTGVSYEIPTAPKVSIEALALRISEMLNYYQQQMNGWQSILTGDGDITLTAPDGRVVTIKSQRALTEAINNTIKKSGENSQSIKGSLNVNELTENGERVYSPNNKPTADDIGALAATKTVVNNVPTYMVGGGIDATSISVNGKSIITDVTEIQSKLTDLNNRAYVTESYQNGDSWYRVYSDGFIEQSSVIIVTTEQIDTICGTLVNLIKPMRTRNYGVTFDRINWGGWAKIDFAHAELYETSFWLASFSPYTCQSYVRWTVRGY